MRRICFVVLLIATNICFGGNRKISVIYNSLPDLEDLTAYMTKSGYDLYMVAEMSQMEYVNKSVTVKYRFDSYEQLYDQIKKEINEKLLKNGDSLFLNIQTHGHPGTDKEQTHPILQPNSQGVFITEDVFVSLRDLLKNNGIKMVILDGSCFSGNALTLSTPNACVITSQSRVNETNRCGGGEDGTFLQYFWHQVYENKIKNKKINIEELFLKIRKDKNKFLNSSKTWVSDQPQISTKSGIMARDLLEPVMAVLYDFDFKFPVNNYQVSDRTKKKIKELAGKITQYKECKKKERDEYGLRKEMELFKDNEKVASNKKYVKFKEDDTKNTKLKKSLYDDISVLENNIYFDVYQQDKENPCYLFDL